MTERPSLRWGFVGTGWIVTAHMCPALRATPGAELVSIVSGTPGRAATIAAAEGIPRAFPSLEAFLADDELDAVYVASRNDLHADQVIACAAAGKHVLCDKPLGLTVAECQAMVDACRRAGVVLATNHHIRSLPTSQTIRRLIAEGRIGTPVSARVSFAGSLPELLRTWRLSGPGSGVALDLTVHSVDTLRYVLDDDVVEVAGLGGRQGLSEDSSFDGIISALRFARGTMACIHDAFTVPFNTPSIELYGTHGTIRAIGALGTRAGGTVEMINADGTVAVDVGPDIDPYVDTVAAFCDAVRGHGRPRCTGEDGLRAVEVALAVTAAAEAPRPIR